MGAHKSTHAFKDNFWSRKRVESGFKIGEVAKCLHLTEGSVAAWFSGQKMPTEEHVREMCDLFDVEYSKGYNEFAKAHREWDADHNRKVRIHENPPVVEHSDKCEQSASDGVNVFELREKLLKAVYGKVETYEQFSRLADYAMHGGDALEFLYDKVDYKTFREVEAVLKECSE